MQSESTVTRPTWVLVAISTFMLQIALHDRPVSIGSEWLHLTVAALMAIFILRANRYQHRSQAISTACMAVLVGLAFTWDTVLRTWSHWGNPLEIQIALTLRNMMLGLAAQHSQTRSQKVASLASCFLALFSILWLMNWGTITLLFIYSIIGMWWLMGVYWDRLSGCFLSQSQRCIPWKPVGGAMVFGILAMLLLLPLAASTHYTTAIEGFLPSSGGTRWQDEFANGGVGDGPQMVSAKENASSFGPIESELFLESKMPSLYDVFNEFSEPASKPKKRGRERAIPLAPSQMQQNHQRKGSNQQTGREFSTVRKQKQESRKVADLRSTALLQVIGRVPVHLGLYTYDLWDGHRLTASNGAKPKQLIMDSSNQDGKKWVRYASQAYGELLSHRERHELRIINLNTGRVPSPPNIIGANIDKMHTEKLFRSTRDEMLALDMEFIPQLTVLHVESLQRLSTHNPVPVRSHPPAPDADGDFSTLAHMWTKEVPRGWQQVEKVCARLRQEYVLAPEAMVPEEVEDAAVHFLSESKQGPDYLFATSAALLLRKLGYETRVVSGFYADAENYDRHAGITSVYAADAHFWIEVLASSSGKASDPSHWIPVEPSPGYEVLLAPESFWSQLLARAASTWLALKSNPIRALAVLGICVIAWGTRTYVLDVVITSWWRVHHRYGDIRHRVTSTLRLLDRRASLRGYPRARGVSLSRWDFMADARHPGAAVWEKRFRDLANWALYGNSLPHGYSPSEVDTICSHAAKAAFRHKLQRRTFTTWFSTRKNNDY